MALVTCTRRADLSMLSINGKDVEGYRLAEYVDCVFGPGVEVIVVALVLHDEAVEVDTVVFLVDVYLEFRCDHCHGHLASSSFEIEKPDS